MNPVKHTLNTIAHMSVFTTGWRLSGFKQLRGAYTYWGVKFENEYYAAMHYTNGPHLKVVSEHEDTELALIKDGYAFPVVMYGSDNTSYVIRFKSEQDRNLFMTSDDTWDCYSINPLPLYYNS
jgi:hypothetical protein